MKAFKTLIGASAEQLREIRVSNVVRNTASESANYIGDLKQQFRNLQSQIEDHMDLGATCTTDIASNLKNFNQKQWVETMYPMTFDLACLGRKVMIAVNVHNQLFPENKVDNLDADDLTFISEVTGLTLLQTKSEEE